MSSSAKRFITGIVAGVVLAAAVLVVPLALSSSGSEVHLRVKTTDNDVKIQQTGRGESIITAARYTDYFTNESGKEREFTAYEFDWRGRTCLLIDEVGNEGGQSLECFVREAG